MHSDFTFFKSKPENLIFFLTIVSNLILKALPFDSLAKMPSKRELKTLGSEKLHLSHLYDQFLLALF